MSSNAIRAVAIVLAFLAIVLAIVGWRMSRSFAENANRVPDPAPAAAQPAVPQSLVVIATHPLAANVEIGKDDVVVAPVSVVPTEYFANIEDVLGKKPMFDLDAGQPVTPRFFKDSNVIARTIPAGYRAVSLKVDDVIGVGGFIRPGDTVDLVVYIKPSNDTPTGDKEKKEDIAAQARVLLKDVLVLSYEEHFIEPPKGVVDKDVNRQAQQQRRERTVVVAVQKAQVTRVLLGASSGDIRLSLHGAQPDEAETTSLESGDQKPGALPINDEAKAKLKAAEPPDQVITAAELGRLDPKKPVRPGQKGSAAPPRPRVEIYRGTKLETVAQ